jgi:hypothetical protein
MNFSIAVKTADRSPNKNYLFEMMKRFGVWSPLVHNVHIVDTGGSDWLKDAFQEPGTIAPIIHTQMEKLTLHQNAARAIRIAANDGADWTMVIEDDIDFCADFIGSVARWLKDLPAKTYKMFVLGANYSQLQNSKDIVWNYPVHNFYGNQALVWKSSVARELANWLGEDPHYNGVRNHGHDLLLQNWGKETGQKFFAASVPSFVQHIGNESGIGNRFFTFPSWPGRTWRYEGRSK